MSTSFVLSRAFAGPVVMVLLGGLPAASAPAAESSYSILHSFQEAENDPRGSLISDGRGNLYGTTVSGGASASGTVFTIRSDGTEFRRLHSFGGFPGDGVFPESSLILDGGGNLYGTTPTGGSSNLGTVFTLRTDGTDFQVLHSFAGGESDGAFPKAALILDGSGNLYGTTRGDVPCCGDSAGFGAVFKLRTDGTGFKLLHEFVGGASDGAEPEASLTLDGVGNLYGTTTRGGPSDAGTVYTIKVDGNGFQLLHSFADGATDGIDPVASLTLDGAGNLYGTTAVGGSSNGGTVFTLRTDGTGFRLLHSFAGGEGDGRWPSAELLLDESGDLYGTTLAGGQPIVHTALGDIYDGAGTVFRVRTDGTDFQLLRAFPVDANDAAGPLSSLISNASGTLYGTTSSGGSPANAGTVFSISTDGSFFQILYTFVGFTNDGGIPSAVISDGSGFLYGTTEVGGISFQGTVFRIRSDGSGFQLLHAFSGGAHDGATPQAPVILDGAGNLYGTTEVGGSSNAGTVFRLRTDGTGFQLLHAFAWDDDLGVFPDSGLTLDAAGNLYGATIAGGPGGNGTGAVFRMKSDGTGSQLLHAFSIPFGAAPEGPFSSLVLDGSGNLYGTTVSGTVFTVKVDGSGFQVLHSFEGGANDGNFNYYSYASLTLDGKGNVYGTTNGGGASGGGTVFKLKTDGTDFKLLHAFEGGRSDGKDPEAGLVLDGFGNLYGTTQYGGPSGAGTVFTLRTDGTGFRLLRAFGSETGDGQNPFASLFLDRSGTLIGTTAFGGAGDFGTVFTLSIGGPRPVGTSGPFVPVRKR